MMCLGHLDKKKVREEKMLQNESVKSAEKKFEPTATSAAAANWRRRGRSVKKESTGVRSRESLG